MWWLPRELSPGAMHRWHIAVNEAAVPKHHVLGSSSPNPVSNNTRSCVITSVPCHLTLHGGVGGVGREVQSGSLIKDQKVSCNCCRFLWEAA